MWRKKMRKREEGGGKKRRKREEGGGKGARKGRKQRITGNLQQRGHLYYVTHPLMIYHD